MKKFKQGDLIEHAVTKKRYRIDFPIERDLVKVNGTICTWNEFELVSSEQPAAGGNVIDMLAWKNKKQSTEW